MTAEVSTTAFTGSGELALPSYERPSGVHPPLDFAGYRSTALRHPKRPLVLLPHRLTEVTGPLLGDDLITATDADLTTQHAGEPQGQRIILAGRVLDSDGRPVPGARVYGLLKTEPQETPFAYSETYGEHNHPDPVYQEHFAVSDVPPGDYTLTVDVQGRRLTRRVRVQEQSLTWVVFRLDAH